MSAYGTFFTITGIIATILFGSLTIYLFYRKRYPGKIILVIEDCIALFDSIVKNFPELSVLYNDSPISHDVVLLKGAFINSGSIDISDLTIEKDLSIDIPDGYEWLQGKIISKSPSLITNISIKSQSLKFDTGLFRRNEFIRFECLVAIPSLPASEADSKKVISKSLLSSLEVNHRIADTQKAQMLRLPPPVNKKRELISIFLMAIGFFFTAFVSGYVIITKGLTEFNLGNDILIFVFLVGLGFASINRYIDYRKTSKLHNILGTD